MNAVDIEKYLQKLAHVYEALPDAPALRLGICGGAALSITGLIDRTTKDIDLLFPVDLPKSFFKARDIVAVEFGLPQHWINHGPKDLTILGLPKGFEERALHKKYGKTLEVLFATRIDQIHFKLYAAADRAGYHVQDLLALQPTEAEIETAARWCFTHDVSDGFKSIVKSMLVQLGYGKTSQQL